MKRKQKDAFQIKLEKETRKLLIKYIWPIAVLVFLIFFILSTWGGAMSGHGIIGFWTSPPHQLLSIAVILLYIALITFCWFMSKPSYRDRAYENMLKEASKKMVERMMTPGEPTSVKLIKAKGDFGDFVLGLQEDGKAKLYAVLGEKDNLIATYAICKEETKKRDLEVVTKEEFADCYRFVDDSENS